MASLRPPYLNNRQRPLDRHSVLLLGGAIGWLSGWIGLCVAKTDISGSDRSFAHGDGNGFGQYRLDQCNRPMAGFALLMIAVIAGSDRVRLMCRRDFLAAVQSLLLLMVAVIGLDSPSLISRGQANRPKADPVLLMGDTMARSGRVRPMCRHGSEQGSSLFSC